MYIRLGTYVFKEKNLDTVKPFHMTKEGNRSECLVCNVPFAVISLSSNPHLWCPCLYWSHFLSDSTFLFDTPCLGKGSITYPHPASTSCKTSSTLSVSVAGRGLFCRVCIFLYLLPAQLRENYRSVQNLVSK